MTALLLVGLLGCAKPWDQLATLDFGDVPFDNPLVSSPDARIRSYETTLPCPDGSPAHFYLVYRADQTEPGPLAVVTHSGAFDYVLDPQAATDSPLYQATWRAASRLSRDWSDKMVWESLGMYPGTVMPSEDNRGALAAALVDAGISQLWPGNCWADLWHDESGFQENDYQTEGINRNGRTFAWWMVRFGFDPDFAAQQGVALPVPLSSELYLAGLGDGARGVVELLTHPDLPQVAGAILDSPPDLLSPYFDPTAELYGEAEGLRRIWGDETSVATIDQWSLLAVLASDAAGSDGASSSAGPPAPPVDTGGSDTGPPDDGRPDSGDTGPQLPGDSGGDTGGSGLTGLGSFQVPAHVALVWSQADPRQPVATTASTAQALAARPEGWVIDTRARAHVFSNADRDAAAQLVDFLQTGTQSEITWQADGAGDSGTGDSGAGDSGTGDSGTGDSGTGDSGTGDGGTGDSGTGDSGTGDGGASTARAASTDRSVSDTHALPAGSDECAP